MAAKSMPDKKFRKFDIEVIKSGKRGPYHKLDLPTPILETEYEERCYVDIDNLGKYIISINFCEGESQNYLERHREEINKYLEKYTHIIINEYDLNLRNKVSQIDLKRSNNSEITRKIVV
jgi:hypothetical protein